MLDHKRHATRLNLNLPIWKGVVSKSEPVVSRPFVLKYDDSGFIIQDSPQNIVDEILNAYSNQDYKNPTQSAGQSDWGTKILESRLKYLAKYLNKIQPRVILEIGAGSFYLGEHVLSEKIAEKYIVVDPSIKEKKNNPDLIFIKDYFKDELVNNYEIDFVISLSCLEHVPNPRFFLENIANTLKVDEGYAFFAFPDVEQQLESGDLNCILHEHISYFTQRTAQALFESCGFSVEEIFSENDTCYALLKRVEKRKTEKSEKTIQHSQILENYEDIISNNIGCLNHELRTLMHQRKNIAFYGATNGLNNFFHLIEICTEGYLQNLYVFDSDVSKHSFYVPAIGKEVIAPNQSLLVQMDKIYISAMSFYDKIFQFLVNDLAVDPKKISPLFACSRDISSDGQKRNEQCS